MTEERDIAEFTIPFAVGTFAAVYLPVPHYSFSLISLSLVAALTAILMHPYHKTLSNNTLAYVLLFTSALCGVFIGYSAEISESMGGYSGVLMNPAAGIALSVKKAIMSLPFSEPENKALLTALVTGDRHGLSIETIEAFRQSGAAHILALSGMHLGIIYGLLKRAMSSIGNGRTAKIMKSSIIISICSLYTLATGAGASITRALLFIILGEIAMLSGRYRSTATILSGSLLIQLILSPSSAKDVGFQLSYAAMAGIAYIYPRLKKLWPEKNEYEGIVRRILRWIWNSASMSIACQITTGPIAWIYFGTFPQYFLLTNLMAIPLVSIIIPSGLLTLCLECCGVCPAILIEGTEWLMTLMREGLEIIASF